MQAASGRRPLVLVGDGAFQMTGLELGHCARYGWDPIVVVLNNGGWGMLSAFRPEARYNALGTWNLARVADALGGAGHLVRTRAELAQALETAVDAARALPPPRRAPRAGGAFADAAPLRRGDLADQDKGVRLLCTKNRQCRLAELPIFCAK